MRTLSYVAPWTWEPSSMTFRLYRRAMAQIGS